MPTGLQAAGHAANAVCHDPRYVVIVHLYEGSFRILVDRARWVALGRLRPGPSTPPLILYTNGFSVPISRIQHLVSARFSNLLPTLLA